MDTYRKNIRTRESEAGVLPLYGISYWPLSGQQRYQSVARSGGEASDSAKEYRLARSSGTGARCRLGERGTRTPGSLFPRLVGNHAVASYGLWFALWIRHL